MSATYTKDPDGVVHLIEEIGDGEFTFCNRDHVSADMDGFVGEYVDGPATCGACKADFDRMYEGMKGAQWKLTKLPF